MCHFLLLTSVLWKLSVSHEFPLLFHQTHQIVSAFGTSYTSFGYMQIQCNRVNGSREQISLFPLGISNTACIFTIPFCKFIRLNSTASSVLQMISLTIHYSASFVDWIERILKIS